mmetsp:Transcript_39957/g.83269  ORF Transcript_39957/g.83269 Transcript_39957/m.83269 type:complete len:248 (+) Transcript_39957:271-1014(+)
MGPMGPMAWPIPPVGGAAAGAALGALVMPRPAKGSPEAGLAGTGAGALGAASRSKSCGSVAVGAIGAEDNAKASAAEGDSAPEAPVPPVLADAAAGGAKVATAEGGAGHWSSPSKSRSAGAAPGAAPGAAAGEGTVATGADMSRRSASGPGGGPFVGEAFAFASFASSPGASRGASFFWLKRRMTSLAFSAHCWTSVKWRMRLRAWWKTLIATSLPGPSFRKRNSNAKSTLRRGCQDVSPFEKLSSS